MVSGHSRLPKFLSAPQEPEYLVISRNDVHHMIPGEIKYFCPTTLGHYVTVDI